MTSILKAFTRLQLLVLWMKSHSVTIQTMKALTLFFAACFFGISQNKIYQRFFSNFESVHSGAKWLLNYKLNRFHFKTLKLPKMVTVVRWIAPRLLVRVNPCKTSFCGHVFLR